jgi:hypothetical protein
MIGLSVIADIASIENPLEPQGGIPGRSLVLGAERGSPVAAKAMA